MFREVGWDMLALTKKTDYGLIALSYLARDSESVVSARTIAEACGVPLPIMTNILKSLTHALLVRSERGPNGGYSLAKEPGAITLYELISAMEGPFQFVQCIKSGKESPKGPCGLQPSCPIRSPAQRIHKYFRRFLEGVTLAELVADDRGAAWAEPTGTALNDLEVPELEEETVREQAT